MSEKSERNILNAIENYQRASGRYRLDVAYETAEELRAYILTLKGVEHVTPSGSLRRGRETVGDLDLLVTGGDPARIADHFLKLPRIAQVLAKGPDKVSVKLADHMQVRGAEFDNGLLKIGLVREVPEAMKPRKIAIGQSGSNDNKQIEQKKAA